MKPLVLAGSVAVLLMVTACSSQDSASTAADTRVTLGSSEIGPVASVDCQTAEGITTITIEAPQKTTVVVTDADKPEVQSVSIGEPGSDGPSLIVLGGVSAPTEIIRDDKTFTMKGSGTGSESGDPAGTAEVPFEIEVTCP
ncbi:lipoprotein LpqH [Mycobacterium sp. ACS4331]|uniref:lipoprotein LpqH n=1 Tax=Mycobacterium sp. ACS4331 TaxID=1834121 RepID=UPI0007FBCA29|nr:lipoprotein LpqH [Mycobacterium sp. ACS4331]OBF17522.1 hypothetical protein A5727_12040 [Mycobacterium sp. ACS4331]